MSDIGLEMRSRATVWNRALLRKSASRESVAVACPTDGLMTTMQVKLREYRSDVSTVGPDPREWAERSIDCVLVDRATCELLVQYLDGQEDRIKELEAELAAVKGGAQ